jgi:hypothetical protein
MKQLGLGVRDTSAAVKYRSMLRACERTVRNETHDPHQEGHDHDHPFQDGHCCSPFQGVEESRAVVHGNRPRENCGVKRFSDKYYLSPQRLTRFAGRAYIGNRKLMGSSRLRAKAQAADLKDP